MAWLDDRIWCHPKFTGLSAEAFRVYVHGLAYSAGLSTGGKLSREQQILIGSDLKTRRELVRKLLWESTETDGEVAIHDWEEHNGKRDARRAADRERKRLARAEERAASAGQDADSPQDVPQDAVAAVRRTSPGQNRGPAHVEGSEGSDGSEGTTKSALSTSPSSLKNPSPHLARPLTRDDFAAVTDMEPIAAAIPAAMAAIQTQEEDDIPF